jgi:hypothetical protein
MFHDSNASRSILVGKKVLPSFLFVRLSTLRVRSRQRNLPRQSYASQFGRIRFQHSGSRACLFCQYSFAMNASQRRSFGVGQTAMSCSREGSSSVI